MSDIKQNILMDDTLYVWRYVRYSVFSFRFSGIVDAAIKKVLERRMDVTVSHNLTPQDIFYREVSLGGQALLRG